MIEAVVFDMGGVIHTVKSAPQQRVAFARDIREYLGEHGVEIPDSPEAFEQKLARADDARRAFNEETLRETPPLQAWTDFYLREYEVAPRQIFPIADELCLRWSRDRGTDQPREGLRKCLANLRSQGMRMGIISNTLSRTYVFTQLGKYGVNEFFESVILSSVCGLRKPGTEIFRLCERSLNLKPEAMAYVGDTFTRDVRGVRDAGWKMMIHLRHPEAKPQVLERERQMMACGYHPDYTIDRLDEIPGIIREYNGEFAR